MLYFTIAWTGLLLAGYLIGTALLSACRGYTLNRLGDRAILSIWLGTVAISVALLAVSLSRPLTAPVGAAAIIGLSALALLGTQTRAEIAAIWARLSWILGLGYGMAAIAVATVMTQPVTWLDTGLYHAGLIRWLFEFGTVPGLALLNAQFGFISSWFALAAPFNAPFPSGQAAAIMNGYILLIAVLQLGLGSARIMFGNARSSDWFATIFFLIVGLVFTQTHFLSAILLSPSPDIPVILLTGTVAWLILLLHEQTSPVFAQANLRLYSPDLLPLILAVGATSIKLTALPLLVFSFCFYLLRQISLSRFTIGSLVVICGLLPFLATSTLISGCPLYPSSFGCIDLPWTQPAKATVRIANQTHGWQTWFGQAPAGANRYLWLLRKWVQSNNSNKLIVGLLAFIPAHLIFVIGQARRYRAYAQIWLAGLALTGTTFMMLKAPMFRFGMGYVLIVPCLVAAAGLQKQAYLVQAHRIHRFADSFKRTYQVVGLAASTGLLIALSAQPWQAYPLLPPPLPVPKLTIEKVSGIWYNLPSSQRKTCWSTELPCVHRINPDVGLRNPTQGLGAGFKYVY